MSAEEVASSFINHYYTTLDSNVPALAGLYQPTSVLTFEGKQHVGPQAIVTHLQSLGALAHNIPQLTVDVQPGFSQECLLIFITGQMSINGDNPLNFSHFFQLISTGPNQFYVNNEMFRLVYG